MKLIILILFAFTSTQFFGGERLAAVVFNGISPANGSLRNSPEVSLEKKYGIVIHKYWPEKECIEQVLKKVKADDEASMSFDEWEAKNKDIYKPIDEDFVSDLERSKLLYLGQYAGEFANIPFKKYPNAVRKFLEGGGVIFFDYFSTTSALNEFLKNVNVENPSRDFKSGSYGAIPWKGITNTLLLNFPHKLGKGHFSAYGWWEKWPDNQIAPFRSEIGLGQRAAMIIQEKVLGKGKIMFSQMYNIFTPADKKILENTLSYIFGRDIRKYKDEMSAEQGGPGEPAK